MKRSATLNISQFTDKSERRNNEWSKIATKKSFIIDTRREKKHPSSWSGKSEIGKKTTENSEFDLLFFVFCAFGRFQWKLEMFSFRLSGLLAKCIPWNLSHAMIFGRRSKCEASEPRANRWQRNWGRSSSCARYVRGRKKWNFNKFVVYCFIEIVCTMKRIRDKTDADSNCLNEGLSWFITPSQTFEFHSTGIRFSSTWDDLFSRKNPNDEDDCLLYLYINRPLIYKLHMFLSQSLFLTTTWENCIHLNKRNSFVTDTEYKH